MDLVGHARRVQTAAKKAGYFAARAAAGFRVEECVVADTSAASRTYGQYRITAHQPKPRPRGC